MNKYNTNIKLKNNFINSNNIICYNPIKTLIFSSGKIIYYNLYNKIMNYITKSKIILIIIYIIIYIDTYINIDNYKIL